MADWDRVKEIFGEIVELPESEQASALENHCAGDAELKAAVAQLLGSHEDAGLFLGRPTLGGEVSRKDGDSMPAEIDGYIPLNVIGEGGFGTVYRARQESPVQRIVALKVIKAGMDSREVIARFRGERQALAMMSHPNIAAVLDAGTTREGRPYFVMEYVPGLPITEYCDHHALSIPQRLELFIQVCHAIQHAHQKGIIHRDLKPGNVLVLDSNAADAERARTDGTSSALAKVIDFGVAKAIDPGIPDHSLVTREGMLIGTPEYMSPEQIEHGADIDTRSDIYALGVMLYELLTGTQPFTPETLRSKGYAEIQRIVREVEPPRPSTRLRESAVLNSVAQAKPSNSANSGPGIDRKRRSPATLVRIAGRRRIDPKSLLRTIRGDLDWIVMKCIEKERDRRYESPNALALDVSRFLNHEPVSAGPPTAAYRLRKYIRRNRFAVAIVGVIVAGLAATTVGLIAAVRARDEAVASRALAEKNEERATRAARKSEAVNKFLQSMIAEADPRQSAARDVTMRDALDRAVAKLDAGQMKEQPAIEAAIRVTIGRSYGGLARFADAETQLNAALTILENANETDSIAYAEAIHERGGARKLAGRAVEAEADLRKALGMFESHGESAFDQTAACTNDLAITLLDQKKAEESAALLGKLLERARSSGRGSSTILAEVINNLGSVHLFQQHWEDAEKHFREAIGLNRLRLGDVHPTVATNLDNLAQSLQGKGDLEGAESAFAEALAIRRKLLGSNHPDVATTLHNLAVLHYVRRDLPQCEKELRESLSIFRDVYGLTHADTQVVLDSLVSVVGALGRFDEAEKLLKESFKAVGELPTPDFARQHAIAIRLVQLYQAWQKPDDSAEWAATCDRLKAAMSANGSVHEPAPTSASSTDAASAGGD